MKKLTIRALNKCFGKTKVLDDFSLDVEEGELLAILGPSGSGKSTLLACLAGLENPDSGEIHSSTGYLFSDIQKINVVPEKRNIGFVFQHYALWPHMSVQKNIAYPLVMKKKKKEYIAKEVKRILKVISLEGYGERYPYELSGGEKQRVALGRALIMQPDFLLLDEPLSNLDARLRDRMQLEIRRIQRELGVTLIHVTHDQSEAMAMSDRIAVMRDGKPVQTGTPEEVYANPAYPFVADFVGANNVYGNSEGIFAVRPEDIVISTETGKDENQLLVEGIVDDIIYKGDCVMYLVDIGNRLIKINCHPSRKFLPGSRVFLDFTKVSSFRGE